MCSSFEEALERYPRIPLTRLPTPLQALPSLSTRAWTAGLHQTRCRVLRQQRERRKHP